MKNYGLETELNRKNGIDLNINNKKLFVMMILLIFIVTNAFCDDSTMDGVDQIKNVFKTIYAFFTSGAIRIIAIAGIIFTGVKIITNKGNPEMMKTLIPIFIACIIIGSASWFVDKFMGTTIEAASSVSGTSWY